MSTHHSNRVTHIIQRQRSWRDNNPDEGNPYVQDKNPNPGNGNGNANGRGNSNAVGNGNGNEGGASTSG